MILIRLHWHDMCQQRVIPATALGCNLFGNHFGAPMIPVRTRPVHDLRILIVDDNPKEFPLIEAGFSSHDCSVSLQTVTIAHLALAEFSLSDEDSRPDLALVDINMPGIDGFELAREFIRCELPTILMSCQIDASRFSLATDMRSLALLKKPSDLSGYKKFAGRILELARRA